MFCLRSWLPLLFIPTNASPLFILSFVILTYILHRPCIYCSALLLILFTSSCQWSDRCFLDFRGDWFSPRFSSGIISSSAQQAAYNITSSPNNQSMIDFNNNNINYSNDSFVGFVKDTINTTATALAGAAIEEAKRRVSSVLANGSTGASSSAVEYIVSQQQQGGEWTGIGLEWLRSLLGRREWTIPCIDVKVRL
ncbi:hypothetical protein UA08_05893 [Talaromyces atroroseus]|uniref:Uncharacterized protein n=1 Tax=Talaromyces atroroseus TaxID=1441469 RepID=A0A225AIR6_TALAT|nr:hypothetical protein UA08_05893 [Talaromyces atroroseus]OKL59233.1 hypothetical protein UA08_05893 [Talaromyces atroroseus]